MFNIDDLTKKVRTSAIENRILRHVHSVYLVRAPFIYTSAPSTLICSTIIESTSA
jgi:hypothetical protein